MNATNQDAVNVCEHGDHPAPAGERFCSIECQRCDGAEPPTDEAECAGICQQTENDDG